MNAQDLRALFTYDSATGVIERIDKSRNRRSLRAGALHGIFQHRGGFSVHAGNKYRGWTKDFFEACCIRKSFEAKNGFVIKGFAA